MRVYIYMFVCRLNITATTEEQYISIYGPVGDLPPHRVCDSRSCTDSHQVMDPAKRMQGDFLTPANHHRPPAYPNWLTMTGSSQYTHSSSNTRAQHMTGYIC
eukprot:GHVU01047999.1.p4 GENE.GHVU01047999.1~~GHVU01047999.1.p4  ORF type:complete len:102 (+),score=8.04 GHVU01047999.1:221-526(+)